MYSNQIMFDLLCQRRPRSKFSKIRGARLIYLPGFIICNVSPHACVCIDHLIAGYIVPAGQQQSTQHACGRKKELTCNSHSKF